MLYVRFEDRSGGSAWALYDTFAVGDVDTNYQMTVSGYSGTAADSLTSHSGTEFTARDVDNDSYDIDNCAVLRQGGFWYAHCGASSPNGWLDFTGATSSAVHWWHYTANYQSLKSFEMYISTEYITFIQFAFG